MTSIQALQILDAVTDPRNTGKLTRADYAHAEAALSVLRSYFVEPVVPNLPADDPKKSA